MAQRVLICGGGVGGLTAALALEPRRPRGHAHRARPDRTARLARGGLRDRAPRCPPDPPHPRVPRPPAGHAARSVPRRARRAAGGRWHDDADDGGARRAAARGRGPEGHRRPPVDLRVGAAAGRAGPAARHGAAPAWASTALLSTGDDAEGRPGRVRGAARRRRRSWRPTPSSPRPVVRGPVVDWLARARRRRARDHRPERPHLPHPLVRPSRGRAPAGPQARRRPRLREVPRGPRRRRHALGHAGGAGRRPRAPQAAPRPGPVRPRVPAPPGAGPVLQPGRAAPRADRAVRPMARPAQPDPSLHRRATAQPLVVGFHALGDAHTTTNPLYGRGCSLAAVQACLLADAFAAHPDDPVARAAAYEAGNAREVEPWYESAVQMDQLGADPAGTTRVRRRRRRRRRQGHGRRVRGRRHRSDHRSRDRPLHEPAADPRPAAHRRRS